MTEKENQIENQNQQVLTEVPIRVDGEDRLYPVDILSKDAKDKIVQSQLNNNLSKTITDVIRLIQKGFAVEAQEMVSSLPEKGWKVAEKVEEPIQSEEKPVESSKKA